MPFVLLKDVFDIELVNSSNFRKRSPSKTFILSKIALNELSNLNRIARHGCIGKNDYEYL